MPSKKVTFRNTNGRSLTNSTTTTEMNRSMQLKVYKASQEYQNNLAREAEQKKRESEKKHKKHSKKNNATKANHTKK